MKILLYLMFLVPTFAYAIGIDEPCLPRRKQVLSLDGSLANPEINLVASLVIN
jgi:hypothetical protein